MTGRIAQTLLLAIASASCVLWAQAVPGSAPVPAQPSPPRDALGRETPRGTVLGFLTASRKGDLETAKRYLNTPLTGSRADTLANQLSLVLDRRLPARLNQLSAQPEGSQYQPDRLDIDLVGTIESQTGSVDLTVQRVNRGKGVFLWLFSKETLNAIPALYEEVNRVSVEETLPPFLIKHQIARIPLFEWLFFLVGMPLLYVLAGLLDALISPFATRLWGRVRGPTNTHNLHLVPKPVRLILIILVIRWMIANLNLPLLTRQFWSTVAAVLTVVACIWLVLLLNAWGEGLTVRRVARNGGHGAVSILRLLRRTIDVLVVFAGVILLLRYFGLNVTAALAGLGVGGIAVALAAQKTLENVIGGISIIADRVVRVGDSLKIGETTGTVEYIGLRSTRIRTPDRSVLSIPNGQISNERLENLSSRDKFLLHPILSLRSETSPDQMRSVLAAIHSLLLQHPKVEKESVRVRFQSFGSFSLDVEVFAYICVPEAPDFLEVQEELLLGFMDAVRAAGTRMAQTNYVAQASGFGGNDVSETLKIHARN